MLFDNENEDDDLHLNDLLNLIKLVGREELLHHEALVARTVSLADHIIIIIVIIIIMIVIIIMALSLSRGTCSQVIKINVFRTQQIHHQAFIAVPLPDDLW